MNVTDALVLAGAIGAMLALVALLIDRASRRREEVRIEIARRAGVQRVRAQAAAIQRRLERDAFLTRDAMLQAARRHSPDK